MRRDLPRLGGATIIHVQYQHQFVVQLVNRPRAPLSSLGPKPRQISKASIPLDNLEGGKKRLPVVRREVYARWQADQAYWSGR